MNDKGLGIAYDEEDSIEFIQSCMPENYEGQLSDDDIIHLVDLIYEYYEEKGFLNDDAEEDIELDEEDLVNYVFKHAESGDIENLTIELVEAVIDGELSYCESLEDEEEEE
ncbi:MAG: hypothetical protein GX921_00940 [Bacteroidales bacterium]|nr:hypothetical protein [Bacteroidales bacterium]